MKNIPQGTVLGSGARAIVIEKSNAENIYVRQPEDRKTGVAALRIIPVKVVDELLKSLKERRIILGDLSSRKYRKDNGLPHLFDELGLDFDKYILGYDSSFTKICEYLLENDGDSQALASIAQIHLPKPFLLLAGISGTGKTRFVRKQAAATASGRENYCLVPVRPDWHEPSDLLGYITRISAEGPRYVVTDVLKFIVAAWKEASDGVSDDTINLKDDYVPFWLCLDEMNLAPVEQYFADYLSVLETREWKDGIYTCEPLLKNDVFEQLDEAGQEQLRKDLKLDGDDNAELWQSCLKHGIEIPPNLIVAGTVNMDETTHGFSRKVIDRALTIDFGEFFPNDYQLFLDEARQPKPKILGHSSLTQATRADLSEVEIDSDGQASINFLEAVNSVLKGTPFELAYRALNELLISVICFKPSTEQELQAVWDDFLMAKVLPRIEGDRDKLQTAAGEPLLEALEATLIDKLATINSAGQRPDLLRDGVDGTPVRSTKKLSWMTSRLENNGFTAFWP